MKIKTREVDGVVVVTIDGNIQQEDVSMFKSRLAYLIDNGKTNIVLNIMAASYITSLCLAIIVDIKMKTSALHGDLKIALSNRLIKNLLEITNLTRKLEVFDSVDEAVAAFVK